MLAQLVPAMARLSAGHAINALAQSAEAVVNGRILPGHSPEETRRELVRIFTDPQVTVRYMAGTTGKTSDKAPEEKALAPVPQRADIFQPLKGVAYEMWPRAWEGRAGPCELVL